jgi:phospholipid-translocating ATPase
MNEKSAVVWDTKVNIFPPVSTSNKVDNMKYGFLMFVPLFFYNQFKYFFNMFFLLLCISQFIEPLKIGFLFTYIGPLIFVLSLSLFNELTDELKRFCRDLEVNRKRVT